jgi:spore maturation protein CgeB
MRFALFYHSLLSDWNHGNAHFLRGYASELLSRGHEVRIFEPAGAWSLENLLRDHGEEGLEPFRRTYPSLASTRYAPDELDLERELDGTDVIIAHEWNDHALIAALGRYRRTRSRTRLLFHDTHHRALSQPEQMAAYDLSAYDGALVFGEVLRRMYLQRRWARRAWTWHEAADTRVFHPRPQAVPTRDLLWIGNWGDDERTEELREFLIEPASQLGLSVTVHGVRYPDSALARLDAAGIEYRGWLSNAAAPAVFAQHRLALHVPRRHYTAALPGIPTIRVFETLACGTPLVSAPWPDAEGLFRPGDFVRVGSGQEMTRALRTLLDRPELAAAHAARGLQTIRERHTCAHRVDELLAILAGIGKEGSPAALQGATA